MNLMRWEKYLVHNKACISINSYDYVALYVFLTPRDLKYCFFKPEMQELNKGRRQCQH